MKKLFLILLLYFLALGSIFAQDNWRIQDISPVLTKEADAVIRKYETKITQRSNYQYKILTILVISVLNKAGDPHTTLMLPFDNHQKITKFSGQLYDSNGELILKISKSDCNDIAANNGFTLFSDNRYLTYEVNTPLTQYTIAYQYEFSINELVAFDLWSPYHFHYSLSVESASLQYIAEDTINLYHRFSGNSIVSKLKKNEQGEERILSWEAVQLPAINYESLLPSFHSIFPIVYLSPATIHYENFDGNFETWNSYGKWVNSMLQGRDSLNTATTMYINQLTANIPVRREKIKAVYEYMQSKTRYVNVSLGIGGFQPIPASEVDIKYYGDCKALSNYTRALLKSIGIEAYYTEIGSGDSREILFSDFPSSNQTNHIILCVPDGKDSIWLECTNPYIPYDYITSFNSDRWALLISEDGGKLTKTPSVAKQSSRKSYTKLIPNEDLNLEFIVQAEYAYAQSEQFYSLANRSFKEQKDYLQGDYLSKEAQISTVKINPGNRSKPRIELYIQGNLAQPLKLSGNRIFASISPLLPDNLPEMLREDRLQDILIKNASSYYDTLEFQMPAGFQVSYIPVDTHLISVIGEYDIQTIPVNDKIQIIRKLIIKEGQFQTSEIKGINQYLASIRKRDNEKIILQKK